MCTGGLLGKSLTQPATLCIFGTSPAILPGQTSRQTQHIDMSRPKRSADMGSDRDAHARCALDRQVGERQRKLFDSWRAAVTRYHLAGWSGMTPDCVAAVAARSSTKRSADPTS
jgi:hypothetical protein